jgi:predicted membrane chloride channel (bestrophin family)
MAEFLQTPEALLLIGFLVPVLIQLFKKVGISTEIGLFIVAVIVGATYVGFETFLTPETTKEIGIKIAAVLGVANSVYLVFKSTKARYDKAEGKK